MIPLHDLEPTRRPPVATRLLLLANVLVWAYLLALDPAMRTAFYDRWALDPQQLRSAIAGGEVTVQALAPLITHQFVHGGWLHILGNLLYLWIFGDNVEDKMGSGPFLLFYLAAGIVAAIGQTLIAAAPMVGASGAIAGVLGAYLVLSPGARVRTLVFLGIFVTVLTLPAVLVIGEWIVIQVVSGLDAARLAAHRATTNVAYYAHIVGFVTGVLAVGVLRLGRR